MTRAQLINSWISSKYCFLVIVFLAIGMLFSNFFGSLRFMVSALLALNMFSLALNCRLSEFRQIGRLSSKIVLILLVIYGLVPLFALALGKVALPNEPGLAAGLVLISILPAAMTSAFWTEETNGNLALTFSMIIMTTILSGILIPSLMNLYVGKTIEFNASGLLTGLIKTVVLPVLIGLAVRHYFDTPTQIVKPYLDVCVKISMLVVISINAAVIIPYVQDLRWELLAVVIAILIHILGSYAVGYCSAYLAFPHNPEMRISIAYATGMRNNSAGIAIALAYFPPLVAVPVILSILFQQPIAAITRTIIDRRREASHFASMRAN
ncbi:MAG: bile acid:sodium symporter family protein [Firmicutes bacterium]|nr:bile acid:sodium symporter family protein [Bacillota bacterium]